MRRRSFLKRVFQGRVDCALVALQVVVQEFAVPDLRAKLHAVIDGPDSLASPDEKRLFYRKIAAILGRTVPFLEYGYWEYTTRAKDAREGFEQWVSEIEAGMATVDEETVSDADEAERIDVEKRYIAVSMIFLVTHPVHALEEMDAEDDASWTRDAFKRLLEETTRLDFNTMLADAVFLVPGSDEDGLTDFDLADEGWGHLEYLT